MLQSALDLISGGYNVIPLHAPYMVGPLNAPIQEWGKRALVDLTPYRECHSTPEEIEAWWRTWPQANIGLVTGRQSGLVILNVNGAEGEEALRHLPSLSPTIWSETGTGRHYWYTYPAQGGVGIVNLGPGLSLIGDGGYVVAPPSLHQSRKSYSWGNNQDVPFAPLPDCFCRAAGQEDSFPPLIGSSRKGTNFHPVPAFWLLNSEPEPIDWIWEGFLPSGTLVLLAAYMKVGKSTFIYRLAVCLAQGKPFLSYPTKKVPVLILALEEHARDVRNRLRQFGGSQDDPIAIHIGPATANPNLLSSIKAYITQHHIGVLIVDTLSRFWGIKDENSNAEVEQKISPLLDLARDTGCVVILVHHERKGGGDQGRSIRGGSALLGLVDQALMLEHTQGAPTNKRILKTLGRYSETPTDLLIDLVEGDYLCAGQASDWTKVARQQEILATITETPKSVDVLHAETKIPKKAISRILSDLGDKVQPSGDGKRGDPYVYSHSFPSQPPSIGEGTNR